jgi:PAS domain S-box-containing protein
MEGCEKCNFFMECIKIGEKRDIGELKKILLVEDNEDHMILTKKVLTSNKLSVDCAMAGKDALKMLAEDGGQYDMILLDYKLPDISGIEFLKTMKQRGLNIPTIMVTGAGSEEVAVEALKLGAIDYIVKSKNYYIQLPQFMLVNFQKFKLEQKIKEARELLKNIIESSPDIIFSTSLDGKITSCNEIAEKILGWEKKEILGERIEKFIPCEALPINEIREKVRKGEFIKDFEVQVFHKNGSLRTLCLTISSIKDISGKIIGISIIARDITEKKEMEQRIAQAEKEVELYARLLTHDINNLNQIAIGYLTLLAETDLNEEQKKLVTKTVASIKNSLKLIEQVGKLYKSKNTEILRQIAIEFSKMIKENERKSEHEK